MKYTDDTPIFDLELPVRFANCITREWESQDRGEYPKQIKTVGDLRKVPLWYFIAKVRCCGKETCKEIESIQVHSEKELGHEITAWFVKLIKEGNKSIAARI